MILKGSEQIVTMITEFVLFGLLQNMNSPFTIDLYQ